MQEHVQKIFGERPDYIAVDDSLVFDARGFSKLVIITEPGATATWSRVDSEDAVAHELPSTVVGADTVAAVEIDWPFYFVSVTGAGCRVAGS